MYVLSNNTTTLDKRVYVADILKIEFTLRLGDVPYNELDGTDDVIHSYNYDTVVSKAKSIITEVITNIKTQEKIEVNLDNIEVTNKNINVSLTINDKLFNYNIK